MVLFIETMPILFQVSPSRSEEVSGLEVGVALRVFSVCTPKTILVCQQYRLLVIGSNGDAVAGEPYLRTLCAAYEIPRLHRLGIPLTTYFAP